MCGAITALRFPRFIRVHLADEFLSIKRAKGGGGDEEEKLQRWPPKSSGASDIFEEKPHGTRPRLLYIIFSCCFSLGGEIIVFFIYTQWRFVAKPIKRLQQSGLAYESPSARDVYI